jgi:protein-disulfide isomerase
VSRSTSRAAALIVALLLPVTPGAGSLAAAPSASPVTPPAPATSGAPLPDLTMAPLVTLPPVRPSMLADHGMATEGYAIGDPDAPVLIEVFADFQCPYCQRFALLIAPELLETWVRPGHARLAFRDFAFLGEESRWAAVAARLAAQQDRFWPFHDLLYSNLLGENVGSYTPDRLLVMGQMAGLDMDTFIAGLQVPAARELWTEIEGEVRQASEVLGVDATPTVFVDGTRVSSPDALAVGAAVQAALDAAGSSPPDVAGSSPPDAGGSSPPAASP